jgi:hypothetical protein
MVDRPARLLTQNRELRAIDVWNWTLPAWAGRLADGRTYNTCPQAGVCAKVCYARSGTYRFRNVLARHQANLQYVLDDLAGWTEQMATEVDHKRHRGGWVRIHDAGDFFTDAYLQAWLVVAERTPDVRFYCYTKEVSRFKRLVEPGHPPNFLWVYSMGGREDHLVDVTRDRVADVFPDDESMAAAGFTSQDASDLLAVTGPPLVGIPANNIPHFNKILAGRTFAQWQAETTTARAARG